MILSADKITCSQFYHHFSSSHFFLSDERNDPQEKRMEVENGWGWKEGAKNRGAWFRIILRQELFYRVNIFSW